MCSCLLPSTTAAPVTRRAPLSCWSGSWSKSLLSIVSLVLVLSGCEQIKSAVGSEEEDKPAADAVEEEKPAEVAPTAGVELHPTG